MLFLVYRNYFIPFPASQGGGFGQTRDHQLNNLDQFEDLVSNSTKHFFRVQNGYTFSHSLLSLIPLNELIESDLELKNRLRDSIKVGAHWNVGVTFDKNRQ